MVGPRHQADLIERAQRGGAAFRLALTAIEQRQLDIFDSGGARKQVEALEHEPEITPP